MKRTKTKRALHALTLLLFSALFYCCADEHDRFDVPVNGKEKLVTFSVKVPGNSSPKTYALTDNDENEVKQIAVLLFTGGKYIYQPIYSNTIANGPDGKTKTFTLKVPEGTYDMVILANANVSLGNIRNDIAVGDDKATALKKLVFANEGKWNTKSASDNYKPIPMWGEKSNIVVSSDMGAVEATLLRMVAKIDVSLTTKAQKDFELTSVYLYNYNSKGQIIPNTDALNESKTEVSKPSVLNTLTKGPLQYDKDVITKDPNTHKGSSCINEIYTFEATAGTAGDLSKNTCLVIGGHYQNDTNETFYRIDFANTADGAITYLPLLRNNQYRVDVQSISGPGLPTTEQAFNSRPVNIKASILNWSDGRFTEFDVNGQYFVGVSQGKYTFSKEERGDKSSDNILSILTNHPDGWKIEITDKDGKITNYSWLECSSTTGVATKAADVRLKLGKNDSEGSRTAYVHVKAGRLDYIVEVTQLNTFQKGIIITQDSKEINEITFFSTGYDVAAQKSPAPQTLNIRWYPSTTDLKCSSFNIENEIKFISPGVLPSNGFLTKGDTTLTIQPTPIIPSDQKDNPFYQRKSLYLYTVSDGVTTEKKTLTVLHYAYNAAPVFKEYYVMDGKQHSFIVRANTPFAIKIKSNPKNVIKNVHTSGIANSTAEGTPVTFELIDDLSDPKIYKQEVILEMTSTKDLFPPQEIKLNCISGEIQDSANSYIVQTNGTGILIPVLRANESDLGKQLGDNEAYTSELLWTDNSNGLADNSNVKVVQTAGTGTKGYILVLPGSSEGNALVGIKNSNKDILWSWHVWTIKDTPKASKIGGFMDRFLGATGDITSEANVHNRGLRYQWGRKDPYPTAGENKIAVPLYDAGRTPIKINSSTTKIALGEAIKKPLNYINNNDWITPENKNLWQESTKTVYDPCPKGWRVPANVKKWSGSRIDWIRYNINPQGAHHVDYGGYYPASGYLDDPNGPVSYPGYGFSWVCQIANISGGTQSNLLIFSVYNDDYWQPKEGHQNRGRGLTIRCMKE
jgi:hypothetical protein